MLVVGLLCSLLSAQAGSCWSQCLWTPALWGRSLGASPVSHRQWRTIGWTRPSCSCRWSKIPRRCLKLIRYGSLKGRLDFPIYLFNLNKSPYRAYNLLWGLIQVFALFGLLIKLYPRLGFEHCIFIICFISPLAIRSKLPEVPQAEIWCRFLLELLTRAPIPAGISPEVVPRLTKLHACRGMPHHGRGQLRCAQPKRNGSLIFFHCLAIPISLPLVLVWYLSLSWLLTTWSRMLSDRSVRKWKMLDSNYTFSNFCSMPRCLLRISTSMPIKKEKPYMIRAA